MEHIVLVKRTSYFEIYKVSIILGRRIQGNNLMFSSIITFFRKRVKEKDCISHVHS
ncbi:hypothetical protein PGB90_004687 [Kerria lacca]